MKIRTKSTILLLATLVVGLGVGALATGAAMNHRLGEIESLRKKGGFVERMEVVIQPLDESQRVQIREVLERSHERYRAVHDQCGSRYAAVTDTMRAELVPLLTETQQTRLDAYLSGVRKHRESKRSGHSK